MSTWQEDRRGTLALVTISAAPSGTHPPETTK